MGGICWRHRLRSAARARTARQPGGTPPATRPSARRSWSSSRPRPSTSGGSGVGADGKVVGPAVGEQARQALRNLATILQSEGASLGDIVHWTIAVVDGHPLEEGYAAFGEAWNRADPPPAITVHVVAGLGPGFLVEIDAVAVA
ncbi:MAG TPA: RidA family protein [Trebonia sp.]|nr:RidA family protein [Trebonia sp.]